MTPTRVTFKYKTRKRKAMIKDYWQKGKQFFWETRANDQNVSWKTSNKGKGVFYRTGLKQDWQVLKSPTETNVDIYSMWPDTRASYLIDLEKKYIKIMKEC